MTSLRPTPHAYGDSQLLMGDQGQVFGGAGARHRQRRGTGIAFRHHVPKPRTLDRQRCSQRIDVVRQGCRIGLHESN